MKGLLFPKPKNKKKRKSHKKSIMQEKNGTCYLCMKLHGDYRIHTYLEEHHIFGGPNRSVSEAEGLKVDLCLSHHREGQEAVHENAEIQKILKEDAQREYEKTHTREEFMGMIGKNYLG